jgi:small GTP-binding protein
MIKKKVCLIGAYAVGKTSLVRQFVSGMFSDNYLSTVGVKIDQRTVVTDGQEVRLMVWDLAGSDEFQKVRKSYLQGAAGILYVADGTRAETLDTIRTEREEVMQRFPGVPSILLINKHDLVNEWEIEAKDLARFREEGLEVLSTSARTGEQVAEAFDMLARRMCGGSANETQRLV